jgi:hypothetical protein
MCCEQLVCASCAHPVGEARCSLCRATRSHMHGTAPAATAAWVAITLVMLLTVAAALYQHLGS